MTGRGFGVWLPMVLLAIAVCAPADAADAVDYNRDIRPLFSKNCFTCHGQDNARRGRKVRLDHRDTATQKRKNHDPAIVPGHPESSELIARVTAADDSERMPPKEAGNRLNPGQVALLKRWIEQGALYAEHWAFIKPTRTPLPTVKTRNWPRNPIDKFVLARLEHEDLTPAPEADRYTLLRRVSLDLRGLPPTPTEVDAFINDHAADAYEKAVDRFLADPAYGERWARVWLDLARYADSAGYGSDPLRTIWPYRDWVIDAFNRNLPYDQFTIEQIAGDLLPHPTLEQRLATAFHRNTMTNTEGGTYREEFRVAAVKDRVDTTFQVWMGLTMGCAKCHDHKYDPITQKDYYRFYAFFNQTADADRPDEKPVIDAPTPALEKEIRRIDGEIAQLKKKVETPTPELKQAQAKWEASLHTTPTWLPRETHADTGYLPEYLHASLSTSTAVAHEGKATAEESLSARSDFSGITAIRLNSAASAGHLDIGKLLPAHLQIEVAPTSRPKPVVGRYVRVELPGSGKILSLAEVEVWSGGKNLARRGQAKQSTTAFGGVAERAIDGVTDGDFYKTNSTTHTQESADPWWEVKLAEPKPIERITVWNRTDGGVGSRLANFRVLVLDDHHNVIWRQDVAEPPAPKRALSLSVVQSFSWARLASTSADDGSAIYLVSGPVASSVLLRIPLVQFPAAWRRDVAALRIAVTCDPVLPRRAALPAAIMALLDTPAAERTERQAEKLASYYRSVAPELQPLREQIARLAHSRPAMPTLPVMEELPPSRHRETHVMIKGNYLAPGDVVQPAVPEAFHALPKGAPLNRLGVARWLVDPNNPLTARVAVNRFWAELFGTGIVETEEDLGTQGELPSHPELLDWLAVEYRERGWNTKSLLRLIVTSATYRQSARVTPELLARDPRNRLLTRGPRLRLEAEMVRDQALALSGLLSHKVHGPSVFPPQPPGLWQAAFNGQRTWATSTGEDRYRRALYTFWRRTIPYPSMAMFDAPSREVCTVRRMRTNTPLQALVTLNDPVYVEAAQALARRILREGGVSTPEKLRYALHLCLCRPPRADEMDQLQNLLQAEVEHYGKDAAAATAMATDPLGPLPKGADAAQAAAWTVIANVLLNLDAVLTKG